MCVRETVVSHTWACNTLVVLSVCMGVALYNRCYRYMCTERDGDTFVLRIFLGELGTRCMSTDCVAVCLRLTF